VDAREDVALLICLYGVGLDDCESSFGCHFGIPPVICAACLDEEKADSSPSNRAMARSTSLRSG
jgi:hypothetical protein